MNIPSDVKDIMKTLNDNDKECFLVGGCVRDSLYGRVPNDYDIATNALPEEVMSIFKKAIPTGIQHGTVTVILNDNSYEITTYRIDGEYINNRKPENVEFVSDIKFDLSRRDFTINSFAYNDNDGLIDYFNGLSDLKNKIIRCVGDPDKRFTEDALRMLRAIRFSAQLNFKIEHNTLESIKRNSELIKNISVERIATEINKCLLCDVPSRAFLLLEETGLLKYIFPDLQRCVNFNQHTKYHDKDVFMHTMGVLDKVEPKLYLRLAALFHDISKPECFFIGKDDAGHFYGHDKKGATKVTSILRKYHYDNETIKNVHTLVKEHMNVLLTPTDASLKRLINRTSKDLIFDLLNLMNGDIMSCSPEYAVPENVEVMKSRIIEILDSNQPLNNNDLKINGNDLIKELNLKPGKQIGEILKYLLDKTLIDPSLNTKDTLLNLAVNYIKK